jgi:hypothetical protein
MKISLISIALVSFLITGCAVGPLVNHETARTVGEGKNELSAGYGQAGYVFKWNHGVRDNLDIGVHWESLSLGIRGKYAFINNPDHGFSSSIALGTGWSIGGSHYYADLSGSYLFGQWEPYLMVRTVRVKTDPVEFRDEDPTDDWDLSFTIARERYTYGQVSLGTRFWMNERGYLSLEFSSLYEISSGIEIDDNLIIGGLVGIRF